VQSRSSESAALQHADDHIAELQKAMRRQARIIKQLAGKAPVSHHAEELLQTMQQSLAQVQARRRLIAQHLKDLPEDDAPT